jgi:hypothetical protein
MVRNLFLCALFLHAVAVKAQGPSFSNRQRTTDTVGITAGQTARLTATYPTAPAPVAQILCTVTLSIADGQGQILASNTVSNIVGGKSVSIDVNADAIVPAVQRSEIHGFTIAPAGCNLPTSLQVIDNQTQKTILVVGSTLTYPPPALPAGRP